MINSMIENAFADLTSKSIKELKEGFFNVAYLIELSNGKIASPKNAIIMNHEKNIMFSETQAMKLVGERNDVSVPAILFYDNSHDLCEVDYFFMKKLSGSSYHSQMNQLSDTEKKILIITNK